MQIEGQLQKYQQSHNETPSLFVRYKLGHMFYKLENRGESINADLNSIERKIWCNRQPEECLWKYIEKFELSNLLDITIVRTEKKEESTN